MDTLIPASKISNLTQGIFVGAVSGNFDKHIEKKIFHAEIVVDNEKVAKETKAYHEIPIITNFIDQSGNNQMKEQIEDNYHRIKEETKQIVVVEMDRMKNDPELAHLVKTS